MKPLEKCQMLETQQIPFVCYCVHDHTSLKQQVLTLSLLVKKMACHCALASII